MAKSSASDAPAPRPAYYATYVAENKRINQKELLELLEGPRQVTLDDLASGVHGCFTNARQLVQDASALRSTSPARSFALAVLAMEETAKIFLLTEFAARALPVDAQVVRREMRSHTHKQKVLAQYGRTFLSREGPRYENEVPLGLIPYLDRLKQLGFYVDLASTGFLSPAEFASQNTEWTDWAIAVATERLDSIAEFHSTIEGSRTFIQEVAELAATLRTRLGSGDHVEDAKVAAAAREYAEGLLERMKERGDDPLSS